MKEPHEIPEGRQNLALKKKAMAREWSKEEYDAYLTSGVEPAGKELSKPSRHDSPDASRDAS